MDVAPEAAPPKILSPRRTDVAHAWLTSPVYVELVAEAQRQRVHPDKLAAMLIEACILGGLVEAVLTRGRKP